MLDRARGIPDFRLGSKRGSGTEFGHREVRVLRGKIMTDGEALHDRSVRSEVAILGVGDLQLAPRRVKRGEHHPGHENQVSKDKRPVSPA